MADGGAPTRTLQIAKGLSLPLDAVTQKFAFLARSGAGKTYAAGKLAEEMLDAGAQIVVLDPVGVWWGLRVDADGKGNGLQIPVFGGERGDIPLGPDHGALVAEVVVEREFSVVLDVSSFTQGELKRFVTAFGERFFELKKKTRTPVHLFLEEAQTFIPQRVQKGEERMLGVFERIGKVGRNYGIGLSVISQRPQAIHKDVLNQTEALFVGQTNGTHERKALEAWIVDVAGGERKLVAELPSLPRGTMFLWSPQWLGKFEKVDILKKRTGDVSATPTAKGPTLAARALAPVDLEQLRDAMKVAVKEAEANDPGILQRTIADLERKLEKATKAVAPVAPSAATEVHLTNEHVAMIGHLVVKWLDGRFGIMPVRDAFAAAVGQREPPTPPKPKPASVGEVAARHARRAPGDGELGKCELAILNVLGTRRPQTTTIEQVAILARYRQSGSFNGAIARLRADGLIAGTGSALEITTEGVRRYPGAFTTLPKGPELLHYWQAMLGSAEGKILGVLVAARGRGLTVDEIADATNYQQSGSFNGALAKLRKLELINRGAPITAHPTFFER